MERLIFELETLLEQLVGEHEKLIELIDRQQSAMKTMDLAAMEQAARQQDLLRQRIAGIEARRRNVVGQLAKLHGLAQAPTLKQLGAFYPAHQKQLLAARVRLLEVMEQVASRNYVAGRLAGAVLGHLNTVVRLLAGAAQQAGVYTKNGSPRLSSRIGAMEAVG
jgi:hypothetical protein